MVTSDPHRGSRRRTPRAGPTAAIPAAIVGGAVVLWLALSGSVGLQILILFAALLPLLLRQQLRECLRGIGLVRGAVVLAFFTALIAGQYLYQLTDIGNRDTYPVVHWGMFSGTNPEGVILRYKAEFGSGELRPFPLEDAMPAGWPGIFRGSLNRAQLEDGPHGEEPRTFRDLMEVLAARYAHDHPDNPIQTVIVRRCLRLSGPEGLALECYDARRQPLTRSLHGP